MLKLFKKAFLIDYEDIWVYPCVYKTHAAIAKHCQKRGYSYVFTGDEEVVINGVPHDICRGHFGFRGTYAIRCREK